MDRGKFWHISSVSHLPLGCQLHPLHVEYYSLQERPGYQCSFQWDHIQLRRCWVFWKIFYCLPEMVQWQKWRFPGNPHIIQGQFHHGSHLFLVHRCRLRFWIPMVVRQQNYKRGIDFRCGDVTLMDCQQSLWVQLEWVLHILYDDMALHLSLCLLQHVNRLLSDCLWRLLDLKLSHRGLLIMQQQKMLSMWQLYNQPVFVLCFLSFLRIIA